MLRTTTKTRTARGARLARALIGTGSLVAVLAASAAPAVAAPPPLAEPSIHHFAAPFKDQNGNEETRAGVHPFKVENTIVLPGANLLTPESTMKDVIVEMPVGFVGNPREFPRCTPAQLETFTCPPASQVGTFEFAAVGYEDGLSAVVGNAALAGLYNMEPRQGQPARFGTVIRGVVVSFEASVRPEDNGITIRSNDISHAIAIPGTKVTMWGVPADPVHDAQRFADGQVDPSPRSAGVPRRPFLTTPTQCDGKPMVTKVTLRTWDRPDLTATDTYEAPPLRGCENLDFSPSLQVTPEHTIADQPVGVTVDLRQRLIDAPDAFATAHLKDVTVALPEGMTINPGASDGLQACSQAQMGVGKEGAAACPPASRIGEVTIDTPLLDEPLTGGAFLAEQDKNPFGSTFAMYIVPESKRYGVRMKLAGEIKADPVTGRLTTTFRNNPQQPFSRLQLKLKGGARGLLVNPPTCGWKTTNWTMTSWARPDNPVSGTSQLGIEHAVPGATCNGWAFGPSVLAGTSSTLAGASSPFQLNIGKPDGHSALTGVALKLPPGLVGQLKGNVGTRVGTARVAAGPGSRPYWLEGAVTLEGPYGGAPFSLRVSVPAIAGPINLGMVEVRQKIYVDPNDASVTIHSDPLPTIVGGVPIRLQNVQVTIDKPGFMRNPTSCEASTIGGALSGVYGQTAPINARFQVGECASLGLDPKLGMTFTNKTQMREGRHPGVEAKLGTISGHANMKQVKATLPLAVALDPNNAKALCEPGDAVAGKCSPDSIIGHAKATTPLLDVPVEGAVYFVKGYRTSETGRQISTLPKLYMTLAGQGVKINVWADSSVTGPTGKQKLVTTFRDVPDVPISDFTLRINSGANGVLKATTNVCGATKTTGLEYTGHNGRVTKRNIRAKATGCKPQVVSASTTRTHVSLRVGGIGAGKLTVRGARVGNASRTIKSADAATIKTRLKLTTAQRSRLSQGRSVRVPVRVSFKPKSGKTVNLRRNVRIEGVKRN